MHARWRFRAVKKNDAAIYVSRDGKPLEHEGTDAEALALACQLRAEHPDTERIEAVSVGKPKALSAASGRLHVRVVERKDGQGWTLEGDLMTGTWHPKLVQAVNYGAFRTRGYLCEIQIFNQRGIVTHVVLIDTTESYDSRLYAPGGTMGRAKTS